jgi:hypothetical protein
MPYPLSLSCNGRAAARCPKPVPTAHPCQGNRRSEGAGVQTRPRFSTRYNMALATVSKTRSVLRRQLETREKLWPGIDNDRLWYRRDRDGFASVPRTMPLLMNIMDDLSGKGFPVGQTYLEMWCRLFDECFLILNRPEEMATHAGFFGQRGVRTWRDRVRRLRALGFIDVKPGPVGEFSYALFWNPYHVARHHYQAGKVQEFKWNALVVRANEIGATDIDQIIEEPLAAGDLDDEIPF